MLKINVVCVGKVKENYFADGIKEYSKRLSKYCDFNLIEVEEENFSKQTEENISVILDRESERILPKLKGKVFGLSLEGKKVNSIDFSNLIKKQADMGEVITFIIGGSYGLSKKVKDKCTLISFGDVTFPHTLFRLILTEQIYRAFTIINGTPYHK